jgi:hypothetical protein
MYLFFLGVLLGIGLPLAANEIKLQLHMRKERKAATFKAAVEAEIQRREADAWGIVRTPHTTGVDFTPDTDWTSK